MSEAWWCPAYTHPGRDDRRRADVPADPHRARRARGSLIVDASGAPLRRRGAELQRPRAHAAELRGRRRSRSRTSRPGSSSTARYRSAYRLGPLGRRDPDPDWLARGETARGAGGGDRRARPTRSRTTVERFNEGAARGEDPDFGRGCFPTTASSATSGRSTTARTSRSSCFPGAWRRRAARAPTRDGRVLSIADGDADPAASTPPATSPRARSASPTRAPAARSARS